MSFAFRAGQTESPERGRSFARAAVDADTPKLPPGFRIVPAQAGDHFAIHDFLLSVFHGPTEREYQATLDESLYEPTDRLLIKRGDAIVAHVLVKKRMLQLGPVHAATGQICELAALPEFRSQGLGSALLKTAEHRLASEGACLVTARSRMPEFLRSRGWGSYTRFCFSTADPRSLLSELKPVVTKPLALTEKPVKVRIRLWRQVELEVLRLMHEQSTNQRFGVWQRSEAFWRWLIVRRAYDRIYVATTGKRETGLPRGSKIVAYAVLCGCEILELVTRDANTSFGQQLLARVCGDAIEQGMHELTLHAPPDDPAHEWFKAAGSPLQQPENIEQHALLAKLMEPMKMLQLLTPLLKDRLSGDWHLALHLERQRLLLKHDDGNLEVFDNATARNSVELSTSTLLNLICGQVDVDQALSTGTVGVSTQVAAGRLASLFPRLPFSWPAWDDRPATA